MNSETSFSEEPPAKRFKAEVANGDEIKIKVLSAPILNHTNDSNSQVKVASSINGITLTGSFSNSKVLTVSKDALAATNSPIPNSIFINVTTGSRSIVGNPKTITVPANLLSGIVLQSSAPSQIQQPGNSIGLGRIQNSVNVTRQVAAFQRAPSTSPNVNQLNRPTVVALNSSVGIPLRIPLQGHALRNSATSVAVIQQVPNSSALSSQVNSVILQQPVLLQQQQTRPFYVLQQQHAVAGKQNSNSNQASTTLVIPQTTGNLRTQTGINCSHSLQQLQAQLLLQKLQTTQPKQQLQPSLQLQNNVQPITSVNPTQGSLVSNTPQPSSSEQPQDTTVRTSSGPLVNDPSKRRQIQQQLYVLLHAKACKTRQNNGACTVPMCSQMQIVTDHIKHCQVGRLCKEPYCCSSIQILNHWDNCRDGNCVICHPIRSKLQKLKMAAAQNNISSSLAAANLQRDMVKTYEILGLNPNQQQVVLVKDCQSVVKSVSQFTAAHSQPSTENQPTTLCSVALNNEITKNWHETVSDELRTHLVHKLVQAVFPTSNTDALMDKRLSSLVENARKVENDLFKEANSREQYYHFLAERIYRIQKDLQEKRKKAQVRDTNGSVASSAQQQLQNILTKKKEELNSNNQTAQSVETASVPPSSGAPTIPQKTEIKSENGIKMEPLDMVNACDGSKVVQVLKKLPTNKKVWRCNELRQYLMPVLEKLYRLDPESLPFRQPVDPVQLNIPDYFSVIKKPMDLSTIKRKLDTGIYTDPWEFVDDVWLMFENAWLYNRKSSRVHKCCTKLAEVFETEIDTVMKSMGFCCGKKYVFYPQVLCCYGKPMCTISVNAVYYSYQNRYVYCESCFNEIKGAEVEMSDDPTQPSTIIQKDLFMKTKNSEMEPEPFVECTHCGRKQHAMCSLHHEPIWPGCFVCNYCTMCNDVKRKENKFVSKNLMQTKLSTYLENRINSFLRDNKSGAGLVTIRVHSVTEKVVEVKPGMKRRFCDPESASVVNLMCNSFPYTAKAIFAYQEIDGSDVCFFGMHVQEYGSNCPPPNTRRVYIAYLDSINFFQPKFFRTSVYHEIIIGYLDYVKNLGYTSAHIWACPPSEGDDYIFHCHPSDMKIPKPKRLADWYKKMLDKAIIERVVIDYKDIIKDALENGMQNVTELPYFEGDFWPNVIETCIAELEQEDHLRKLEATGDIEDPDSVQSSHVDYDDNSSTEMVQSGIKKNSKGSQGSKKKTANKKNAVNKKSSSKVAQAYPGNDLMSKLFVMMEKHREVFFVVRLKTPHESQGHLPPIRDLDPLIASEMMDGRDNFLMICREKHYEFSSLRRAKHSSMIMLFELHTQAKDSFVYVCNYCRANIETHYHCSICDDFDLCVSCYQRRGHAHPMDKIGLDLDDDDENSSSKATSSALNGGAAGSAGGSSSSQPALTQQEAKKLSIQKCIQSLVHACYCRPQAPATTSSDPNVAICQQPSCLKMKRIMQHGKSCLIKSAGGCGICKQLVALCCYHAKDCSESQCLVPFCVAIRTKVQQQQMMMKHQQAQMLKRRMAAMAGIESHRQTYCQAPLNPRGAAVARQAANNAAGSPQVTTPQARAAMSFSATAVRQVPPMMATPTNAQKKVPSVGNTTMTVSDVQSDATISVTQESLQKLLHIKNQQQLQQQQLQQSVATANKNIQDQTQFITVLKNNPQMVQAYIKKEHTQTPSSINEDGNYVLELISTPAPQPVVSNSTVSSSPQPRQQQFILTCNNNNLLQRSNLTRPGSSGTLITNANLLHLNSSNHHLMLSQTQSNINLGASQMQDSTLPLQDQLSRYADQL